MRVERSLVGLLFLAAVAVMGCGGGRLAYNIPPASRLMEPGPGVGGPGPGVIPPAGSPYGMYGGAVNRYGGGTPVGGPFGAVAPGAVAPGAFGGPCAADNPGAANSGIVQASFNTCCDGSCPCGESCDCGPGCGDNCGCMGDGCMAGGCLGGGCLGGGGLGHGHGHGILGHGGICGGGDACGNCPCYIRPGSTEAYADGAGGGAGIPTSQVSFLGEEGVMISWDVGGYGMFDSDTLVVPGRQDFYQGAIYRLRLTNIPGRAGVELFPTLEIAPVTPRTDAFLAHSPIPVQFTEEDFDQVLSGNFVTKVIYLPDPEFQELALAGVETLVSTRLDPGVDPIAEADRRGSILAILRMGNKDLRGGNNTVQYEPQIVPASHTESGESASHDANQAVYNETVGSDGQPAEDGVIPAQYCDSGPGYGYSGTYAAGMGGPMPVGMPTSGMAPRPLTPNMIAGAPQWGMPITGTPIGLPGPAHVPLGVPAGLQRHVMKNRTKYMIPPPPAKVELSVKQRPGLNYPRPVNHVKVDETQREPLRIIPSWLSGMFHTDSMTTGHPGAAGANCDYELQN